MFFFRKKIVKIEIYVYFYLIFFIEERVECGEIADVYRSITAASVEMFMLCLEEFTVAKSPVCTCFSRHAATVANVYIRRLLNDAYVISFM